MRTLVGEVKGDSYILETYLWLPANVIKSKPRAETRLNTGVGYQGEWTVGESNELFLRPRPPGRLKNAVREGTNIPSRRCFLGS